MICNDKNLFLYRFIKKRSVEKPILMNKRYYIGTVLTKVVMVVTVFFSIWGCIPQRETVILQKNVESKGSEDNPYGALESITERYFLQVNDLLFIQVSTPDPKVSSFFNAQSSGTSQNASNQNFFYYPIDDRMEIDFPYAGKINLSGCNVKMAKERVREAVAPFLQDFTLTVRLASNSFTALGEVGSPGVHTMNKDQITILEALAIAGDFKVYAKRKDIKLLRKTPQGTQTYTIDITDERIVNSEYYYVYPNDVIYVRPMKAKNWGIGESISFGLVTSLLALTLTIRTLFYN